MERKFNFSAGPGALPVSVLEEARDEMLSYGSSGASVMEISHRSTEYTNLAERTRSHLRTLLGLDTSWHILFLQGGASMQFYQLALNFLSEGRTADYINTGAWSKKAIAEAQRVGTVHVAGSSDDRLFSYIPDADSLEYSTDPAYVHYTSNNTIFGTEFPAAPSAPAPLICDASSDFLSRPTSLDGHGLVYAGAQKNIGPAGVTVVLIRDSFLESNRADLPTMLDYKTHTAKLFNTPPVFAVYMVEKVLRWVLETGGLQAMAERNEEKAAMLYDLIDAGDFFRGTVEPDSRSRMNVTFRLPSEDLEATFIQEAKQLGLLSLKGHRSVGGIRASIYNACPIEAVRALTSFMEMFENKYG